MARKPISDAEKILESSKPSGFEAFGRGVARGVVGPTVDLIDRAAGLEEGTQELMEEHSGAALAGEVLGYAGGAVTGTGIGGMLTKAGAAATKKYGKGALTKLAIGATEGATIGLAEGTSNAALDNRLGLPGASSMIMQSAGMGAALGGGMSIFGSALGGASNWLFKKTYEKGLKKVAAVQAEKLEANKLYNAYKDELISLEKAGLADSQKYKAILGDVDPSLGSKAMGSGRVASYIRQPNGLDVVKSPIWKAAARLNKADKSLSEAVSSSLKDVATAGSSASKTIGTVAGAAVGANIGHGAGGIALRYMFAESFDKIGSHILKGLHGIKPLRKAMGRSLKAGELSLEQTEIAAGRYIRKGGLPRSSASKFWKVPPISAMSDATYQQIHQEVMDADVGSYESSIRMSLMSQGVPQELANEHMASQVAAVQYLQQSAPQVPDSQWLTESGHVPTVSEELRLRFARRIRAVLAPESVLSDFVGNELTPDAAEAWHAVYPGQAKEFAEMISNNVEIAIAHGKKFTSLEQRQIGLLIKPYNGKIGRVNAHNLIKKLQGNYKQEPQQQSQPQNQGNMALSGINNQYLTANQMTQKNINQGRG